MLFKKSFKHIGKGVVIGRNFICAGHQNISIGDGTSISHNTIMYSTNASLTIGRKVMFGPNVVIVTGDHRTDIKGIYMIDVTENMKLPENDLPVIIEDDVWIGANVTILKGVTIGEGSIVAAGAVVYKNIPAYTVYINEYKQKPRFTPDEIKEHKEKLKSTY